MSLPVFGMMMMMMNRKFSMRQGAFLRRGTINVEVRNAGRTGNTGRAGRAGRRFVDEAIASRSSVEHRGQGVKRGEGRDRCSNAANKMDHTYQTNHAAKADGLARRSALQALLASIATFGVVGVPSRGAFAAVDETNWATLSDDEWQKQLGGADSMSYRVLRKAATERPFTSPLNKEYRPGTFVCAGCGSKLFDSTAKFNSGTGWPSFVQALPGAVDESEDLSIIFMPRTEVSCHTCHGHLGHVFPDGPEPTGLRYCMNGAALKFEPEG